MDLPHNGQVLRPFLDGLPLRRSRSSSTTAAGSHHQLRETTRRQSHFTQRDPGARGAVFGGPVRAGSNRGAEVSAARTAHVVARDQECYSVRAGLSAVFGRQVFTQRYDAGVVHGQLGYSGVVRSGAERGLPLSERLRPDRGW